jgi:hypothetical protein
MAVKLGDALLYLGADDDKLKRDLNQAQEKTKGWGGIMTGVLQGIGQGIAGAVTGIISGAMQTIGESIGLASDLAETTSKVRTLFGESSAGIEDWANGAAANLGMTTQAALDATASIGNMFMQLGANTDVAADTSQSLVQLATDLGSFHNADPTEVLDSISAALRGEYDSLQRYIPTINAAAVEQQALADTGKTAAGELTDLEKSTAAVELIMGGAGAAVGDFARTSDGWANTMRTLNAYWEQFKTLLGETLLPVLTPLLEKVKDLANTALPALANFIHNNVIPAIEAWGANFDNWWADHGQPFIDQVTQAWNDVLDAAKESMGDTETEFGLNLESLAAIAKELGKAVGGALGESIGEGFDAWWDGYWGPIADRFWNTPAIKAMLDFKHFMEAWGDTINPPQTSPSSGGSGGFSSAPGPSAQSMNSAVTINNYVDATSRSVGEAARDGTLDGLRQAGMR